MTDTVEHSGGMGNTEPSPDTKQRSRGWCFTLNNYSDEEHESMKLYGHTNTLKFVVGQEVAPTTGTKHLQGYYYHKNAQTLAHMKKVNGRAHWEKARGSPDQNRQYCIKTDASAEQAGFEPPRTLQDEIKERLLAKYEGVVWRPWQQALLDIVETEPDTRTINWVYDPDGNSGKSFLTKYLALTHEVIIADGKKDNIFNQVKTKLIDEEKEFRLVILDIPRSSEGYINYGVLEQLKNGLIYSGKYEGGTCLFDAVHVIVFANFEPELKQFSQDRWNIIPIDRHISCCSTGNEPEPTRDEIDEWLREGEA